MADRTPRTGPVWLMPVAIAALAVGVVVASVGLSSAVGALDARSAAGAHAETQLALVVDAEQRLSGLLLEVERTQTETAEAKHSIEQTELARDTSQARLSAAQDVLQHTEEEIPERVAEARAFINAMGPLADLASAHVETARQIADVRAEQVNMGSDGDTSGFNRLQDEFNEMADAANIELEAIDSAIGVLPSLSGAHAPSGVSSARFTVSEVVLDPPRGRAQIEVTTAEVIPCEPLSTNGCRYSWVATFTETNWLDVTIERIAIRYIERGGRMYWYSESGEWRDVHIVVPAGGSTTYDNWVRIGGEDDARLVIGGKLKLRWQGTDADDNSISGSLTVPLERP